MIYYIMQKKRKSEDFKSICNRIFYILKNTDAAVCVERGGPALQYVFFPMGGSCGGMAGVALVSGCAGI